MDAKGFEDALKRDRYDEILIRDAAPGSGLNEHSHSFDVRVLILEGSFFVATQSGRTECSAGETFELKAGQSHTEGAGPAGARLLIGRRHTAR
ncbi:MAG: hypothetical protein NXI18_19295 [Alphaproteobacteria bacterium]|nr:hypothetical protein [Alphaproteobacteria bacterium]